MARFASDTTLKLRLDGTINITHPNGSTAIYPLTRLTKLYDSLEQFEDDGWEGEDGSDQGSHIDNALWHLNPDGTWRYDHDDSEWEDEDSDEDDGAMDVDTWADEIDIPLGSSISSSLILRDVTPDVIDSVSPFPVSSSNTSPDSTQEIIVQEDDDADSPWKKFEVLPGAPHDHAFYSSVSNQPSKNFLARLTKEYRALSTSLPGLYCQSFLTFSLHTNQNRFNSRPCVRGSHRSIEMPHHWAGEYTL
jgi:ubiquitin-conjugating enzyme E2 O